MISKSFIKLYQLLLRQIVFICIFLVVDVLIKQTNDMYID